MLSSISKKTLNYQMVRIIQADLNFSIKFCSCKQPKICFSFPKKLCEYDIRLFPDSHLSCFVVFPTLGSCSSNLKNRGLRHERVKPDKYFLNNTTPTKIERKYSYAPIVIFQKFENILREIEKFKTLFSE